MPEKKVIRDRLERRLEEVKDKSLVIYKGKDGKRMKERIAKSNDSEISRVQREIDTLDARSVKMAERRAALESKKSKLEEISAELARG